MSHYHGLPPEHRAYVKARANARQKVRTHLDPSGLAEIERRLLEEQQGRCACCGDPGGLAIEWSHDQTNDAGTPLLRALICKSCATYVTRLITRSRPIPEPKVAMLDTYLRTHPWRDPVSYGLLRNFRARPTKDRTPDDTRAMVAWFGETFGAGAG